MEMWAYTGGQEIVDGLVDYWIEGIGCLSGPHFPFWWTATSDQVVLLACYDGDTRIFGTEFYKDVANVTNKSYPSFAEDISDVRRTIFDLQGRRVSSPKKGVYIRDGRKVVVKWEEWELAFTSER